MNELVKKVLTDKKARNSALLSSLAVTLVTIASPWQ